MGSANLYKYTFGLFSWTLYTLLRFNIPINTACYLNPCLATMGWVSKAPERVMSTQADLAFTADKQ